MFKELLFRIKIKRLNEMHIKQYLERKGYELINIHSPYGQELISTLEIDHVDETGFVYNSGKLNYVFLGNADNKEDRMMTLLHECGHIELNHQSISKLHEAEAWTFAYNVRYAFSRLIRMFLLLAICVVICAELFGGIPEPVPDIAPVVEEPAEIPSEPPEEQASIVYITPTGRKYHNKDCYTIKNSNLIECNLSDIQDRYGPCKICIK